jgi:hypothetical protein
MVAALALQGAGCTNYFVWPHDAPGDGGTRAGETLSDAGGGESDDDPCATVQSTPVFKDDFEAGNLGKWDRSGSSLLTIGRNTSEQFLSISAQAKENGSINTEIDAERARIAFRLRAAGGVPGIPVWVSCVASELELRVADETIIEAYAGTSARVHEGSGRGLWRDSWALVEIRVDRNAGTVALCVDGWTAIGRETVVHPGTIAPPFRCQLHIGVREDNATTWSAEIDDVEIGDF